MSKSSGSYCICIVLPATLARREEFDLPSREGDGLGVECLAVVLVYGQKVSTPG